MIKGTVCGHYVAVIPDEIEKISAGGIILAEEFDDALAARVKAARTTGTVISVGSTAWRAYDGDDPNWKPWAEVGDSVIFQKHVAKVIEDKDSLDDSGRPTLIFIMADENITWNKGKAEETKLEEVA